MAGNHVTLTETPVIRRPIYSRLPLLQTAAEPSRADPSRSQSNGSYLTRANGLNSVSSLTRDAGGGLVTGSLMNAERAGPQASRFAAVTITAPPCRSERGGSAASRADCPRPDPSEVTSAPGGDSLSASGAIWWTAWRRTGNDTRPRH